MMRSQARLDLERIAANIKGLTRLSKAPAIAVAKASGYGN